MTNGGKFDADVLRDSMVAYGAALEHHRATINALNVYPVPDGDTGTNMALTIGSVVAELDSAGPDMAAVCAAIAKGSLMGARGNSGVILSQLLRAMVGELDVERVDGEDLARALTAAAVAAYGAVGNPVEGTILTVARVAGEAAVAADSNDVVEVLDAARTGAADALDKTPEMLQVLADAGVVDAGGSGFLLFLDVLLHVVDGRAIPEPAIIEPLDLGAISLSSDAAAKSIADLKYEVMF
ncbi:MAG: DAK2 domain-containing protein, partial [Acidimicrobiales bacterium]